MVQIKPEIKEAVISAYMSGERVGSIARSMGIHRNTISTWIKQSRLDRVRSVETREEFIPGVNAIIIGAVRMNTDLCKPLGLNRNEVYYLVKQLPQDDETSLYNISVVNKENKMINLMNMHVDDIANTNYHRKWVDHGLAGGVIAG